MKTITIGRGPENMVILSDPKVSRRHAILRCYPSGKIEIVDLSQNGTFVNGIRIASNKPFPVSRKDIVDIAHAEKLEWKSVPDPYRVIKHTIISIIAVIVIVCLGTFAYSIYDKNCGSSIPSTQESVTGEKDSSKQPGEVCPQDSLKAKKKDGESRKNFFPEKKPSKDVKKEIDTREKKEKEKDKSHGDKEENSPEMPVL